MPHRLDKLRRKLAEKGLDAILISQAENRRYLSGFTGSAGFLLVSQEKAILATDFRYVEQATQQAPDFQVVQIRGELPRWFPELASALQARKLGFESSAVTFATYKQLFEAVGKIEGELRSQLVPTDDLVESLRAIKAEEELARIERAVAIADAAIEHITTTIQPGMTEKQVAWEAERFLRENGSQAVPFDIIVASGPNSALPHARPSERAILPGEPIVIDLGAQVDGYCSDLTRTLCLGEADQTFDRIYDVVLGAQLTAIATLEVGMTGDQGDKLARMVIEQAGYGEAFGHGLGHGVGLAVHEQPRLGRDLSIILTEGMVVTLEPGIYLKGWGGIRIEDMVVLEKGRARVLTKAKKVRQG